MWFKPKKSDKNHPSLAKISNLNHLLISTFQNDSEVFGLYLINYAIVFRLFSALSSSNYFLVKFLFYDPKSALLVFPPREMTVLYASAVMEDAEVHL